MAKKRKKTKDKKEEYEFKPPEFDEKEFLKKEIRDTKTVLLTVAYAGLLGVVAGIVGNVSESLIPLGLVLLVGGLVSLRYFYPIIKVDISQFQKKNWAGNVAWFFFTFLAVWVLTFNYPLADHANPTITDVTVWVDNGTDTTALDYKWVDSEGVYMWTGRWEEDPATVIRSSEDYIVNISARITDNGRLSTTTISVNGGPQVPMTDEGDHRFGFVITGDQLTGGSLTFVMKATDAAGHETVLSPTAITVLGTH